MAPRLRRRKPDVIEKAAPALPAGSTTWTASEAQAFAQGMITASQIDTGLPRLEPQVPFGPGLPFQPAPIDPVEPETGRPAPRQYEYPVSYNLPGINGKLVPWKTLRDLADVDLVRRCIEIRKAQLCALDWTITIDPDAVTAAQELITTDGAPPPRGEIENKLRDQYRHEIDRITEFWEQPDQQNGYSFAEWLGCVLEELVVLDALAIYPHMTNGGQLHALEVIDGSTIKPLIDHRGMRPSPPNPAYQQILWGFPRGEFTATVDPDSGIVNPWNADSLIYKRRVVRSWTPYGYSPVEQAMTIIKLWLNRQQWMASEYDDGTMPTTFLENKENYVSQPAEMREYETALNTDLAGSARQRHRMKLLPPGFTAAQQKEVDERYRPDYDTYLVKLMAVFFDLSPTSLGFMETGGLGGSSYHEGQADIEQRKGILPWTRWLESLFTQIMRTYLNAPDELIFTFLGLDDEDEAAAVAVTDQQFRGGQITLNEVRDKHGLPRFQFKEADEPVIVASRNIVFINGEMDRQAEQAAAPDVRIGDDVGGQPVGAKPGMPNQASPAQKADELEQFARFVEKGPRRDFVFKSVGAHMASNLNEIVKNDILGPEHAAKVARESAKTYRANPDLAALAFGDVTVNDLRKAQGLAGARDARGRDNGPVPGREAGMAGLPRTPGVEPDVWAAYSRGGFPAGQS